MKKTAPVLLIVLVMLVVACQDEAPEATVAPEPTMVATAVPTEGVAPAAALPRAETLDECFVEMPEGAAYECLRVEVPELRDEDNGRSIKLGVIRLLSTADTPAEPLFFAEGGPGGSNVETAPLIARNMLDGDESVYTALLSTRDLVFFTQRGTLYAEPALMCSEETMGPVLEAFTAGASAQEREQVGTEALKACFEEFAEAGVDFAAYNSVENAADVNSIREVLGYDQIVLYGDSYGTVLSQHVMRDYPDTLTAVILDGVDTLSAPSWVTQEDAEFQSALEYVIGLCEADEACSGAYPNLAGDVEAVYQKLQAEPYMAEAEGTQYILDENLAASALFNALYDPSTASILPLAVDSLLNDKQDDRIGILPFLILPRFQSISLPMHYAMVCSEDPVTSVDDARSLGEVYSVVSEYARSDASSYVEMCSYMNLPVLPDETDLPVTSDVPVLLLSGALDPATPASNAEEVLATLPNGFSLEFPYGGHVQFLTGNPCAESIVASFLADPTTEPDSSCIAEALPLEFHLPAEQTEATATVVPTEEADTEPTEGATEAGDTVANISDEQLAQMAAVAPPPQLSEREPGIHTLPCFPTFSPGPNEVEGEDYTCGAFTVPQNWDEPDGPALDLAFAVAKATGENPEPDPLVYLAGGPGESAVLSGEIWHKYEELRPDRDIVLLDIRGVGQSQRLGYEECLVLALQHGAPAEKVEAVAEAAATLVGQVSGEGGTTPKPVSELNVPVLNAICWEQFTAQGIDPSQFTTAANARDVVELIKALGYESFNIDSVSYGTRLAMTIMDDIAGYNDAPELRSVVLDSTFPPSAYLVRTIVRSDHDFILQLLDECQADAACNEAYPNLKWRLDALLKGLEEEPLTANGETVTVEDVVKQLRDLGELRAAYIPKMIAELEMGVLDTYLALRDLQVGTGHPEPEPVAAEELDLNDPVQVFIRDATALLSGEAALEFPLYVNLALAEEDPLATLQALIEETYTGETAEKMTEMLGALTAEDLANSPYVAQLQAEAAAAMDPEVQQASMREGFVGQDAFFLFTSIHCADDILHERFEDALNSYNDLQFPQVTDLVMSQAQAGRCENWPVAPAPIEVKDPVSSTVPALILQGAYDKPTPIYMGRRAARELENSTYVLIPQQAHGTWRNAGGCVGQIATAFVQDPEAELDLTCLEARQPQWALPGDGAP
jgi:pimeloyl-ACP methyl ester carboxylesterase